MITDENKEQAGILGLMSGGLKTLSKQALA
jgi:hypothetical protein